jgi:lysozyme
VTDRKPLFDAIRTIKGSALTLADVAAVNRALGVVDAPAAVPDPSAVDPELIAQLKIDEGLRLKAYKDTVGVWTVGYGHAHVAPGTVWTELQAEAQLRIDVARHNEELAGKLPWIAKLDPVRRRVLQNMAFNLGIAGLLGFKNTLEYVRTGQYDEAANGMLASKWARQVGNRAVRLAKQMRTGA